MRKRFLPFAAIAGLATAACAAPATTLQSPSSTPAGISGNEVRVDVAPPGVIEFPYHSVDLVWRVLPAAFAELKLPGAVLDSRGRVYGSEKITAGTIAGEPTRSYFRCSTDGSAASGATALRLQFGITATPKPAGPTKTELVVQIVGQGTSMEASRSGTINCITNGRLETKLRHAVEAELRKI